MSISDSIIESLIKAFRPIFLIGAGVRQARMAEDFRKLAEYTKIPVLSSSISQDVIPTSPYYFGYIGSHGLRYSNLIMSESDLIIVLGNRLAFNHDSETFGVISNKKIIQVDVENETISTNLKEIVPRLFRSIHCSDIHKIWYQYCSEIKRILRDIDTEFPVDKIVEIMKKNEDALFVSDVGNNSFWVTRAYASACVSNRLLLSKSFAALGCSIPKAIGAYFATHKPILCFIGDQGLCCNIQELHFIAENKLPIIIILLNNYSSGMIYSIQKKCKHTNFIHTVLGEGYSIPNFKNIAEAFKISLLEISISKEIDLPKLPRGNLCYDFEPGLSTPIIAKLENVKRTYYANIEANRSRIT